MSEHAQQRHPHSEPGDAPGHEDEFDLIGDDDLGVADLGPIAPGIVDPDAGSGQIRKVPQAGEHQPR